MKRLDPRPPLLIDFAEAPDQHCTDCLDHLFKAMAVAPAGTDDKTIWRPHDNPWLAPHIEAMSAWFQRVLLAIQDTMSSLITGSPIGELRKAEEWRERIRSERDATLARLEAKGATAFTLQDWLEVVDILLADYLPEGVIADMGEFLATRAQLMGKVQGEMERSARPNPGSRVIGALLAATPMTRRNLPPKLLTPVEAAILEIAQARAAIFISDLTADARKRIGAIILEHVQRQILGERQGTDDYLKRALFDEFGQLNRDFRRIAVTEAGEAFNTGYIAGQGPGTRVMRVENYFGACEFCRGLHGRVFKVVEPNAPDRNGATDVWVGKTNARRSASKMMKENGQLIERNSDQRWWAASGVQHPHCRGRWVPAAAEAPVAHEEESEFRKWLRAELARIEVPAPTA